MRTAEITLNNETYPLCYSTAVMMAVEERGETVNGFLQKVDDGNVTAKITLLHDLMCAGHTYAKACGQESPEPPTVEQLKNTTGPDDFDNIAAALHAAVVGGKTPKVEVQPPKKGKGATQAK